MILTPFAMFRRVVGGTIAQAVQTGQVPEADARTWWEDLERRARAGRFFGGFSGMLVCGRRP
jgi:hypothetical protein